MGDNLRIYVEIRRQALVRAAAATMFVLLAAGTVRAGGMALVNIAESHGKGRYEWTIFPVAEKEMLDRIASVEYTLHPSFKEPVVTVRDAGNNFAYTTVGWGEFTVYATVNFNDDTEPLSVSHRLSFSAESGFYTIAAEWWDEALLTVSGDHLKLAPPDEKRDAAQRFALRPRGNGFYAVAPLASEKCLTVKAASGEDRSDIALEECATSPEQWFRLSVAEDGSVALHAGDSDLCLSAVPESATVGLSPCGGDERQQWRIPILGGEPRQIQMEQQIMQQRILKFSPKPDSDRLSN